MNRWDNEVHKKYQRFLLANFTLGYRYLDFRHSAIFNYPIIILKDESMDIILISFKEQNIQ